MERSFYSAGFEPVPRKSRLQAVGPGSIDPRP